MKAGGGHVMTIGEVATHFLTKLEWYSTLFPRIPVPIQKQIEQNLLAKKADRLRTAGAVAQGRTDANRPVQQQEDRYGHVVCSHTVTVICTSCVVNVYILQCLVTSLESAL